jgi:predicted enzyme related to lactoylglutathione lyase
MPNPIVHFEIIGKDAPRLRDYYKALFDWDANIESAVAIEVSEAGNYGFIEATPTSGGGIPGGIGGGPGYVSHALFYVGVESVTAALEKAEQLGGKKVMGPVQRPDGTLTVAHFTDPEGNLIGLAGAE